MMFDYPVTLTPEDGNGLVAFDLVCRSVAFAFLHEFRHVMYCADNSAPSTLPEEEIACDVWARDEIVEMLLDELRCKAVTSLPRRLLPNTDSSVTYFLKNQCFKSAFR